MPLSLCRHLRRIQNRLGGCFGPIVPFDHATADALFWDHLHVGLEKVDLQAQHSYPVAHRDIFPFVAAPTVRIVQPHHLQIKRSSGLKKCLSFQDVRASFGIRKSKTRRYNIRKVFNKARKETGLDWIQIKDLRRHYGIVLSEYGAEIHVTQAMLGHSSVKITEEHYAHFSPHYAARRAFQVLQGRQKGRKTGGINKELKSA